MLAEDWQATLKNLRVFRSPQNFRVAVYWRLVFNYFLELNEIGDNHMNNASLRLSIQQSTRLRCLFFNRIWILLMLAFWMIGPPDPPGNCTIQSESTETVRVICQPGSDHGSNQSYSLLVFNRSQMLVENTTLVEPSFSISGLELGREYFGIIYSFNAKGRSHLRNLTLHSINEPMGQPTIAESGDKRATPLLTPTISTIIGVVAAVLSIALLVMGIICRPRACHSRTPSPISPLGDSAIEMSSYHQVNHTPRAKRQLHDRPNTPNTATGVDGSGDPGGSNEPIGLTIEPLVIVGPMSSSTISDAIVTFPLDRFTSANQQSQPFQFLWYQ